LRGRGDSKLLDRELGRLAYDVTSRRVQSAEALRSALEGGAGEVVLSDYSMPSFDAVAALRVLKESGRDVPFIVGSGSIGDGATTRASRCATRGRHLRRGPGGGSTFTVDLPKKRSGD